MYEVQRPAFERFGCTPQRSTPHDLGAALPASTTDLQIGDAVNPPKTLVVHVLVFDGIGITAVVVVEPPAAMLGVLLRDLGQLGCPAGIVVRLRAGPLVGWPTARAYDRAGLALN